MIQFQKACFAHGELPILKDFDFKLGQGGVTVLLGPSGCGKSTLLHLAAGLLELNSGNLDSTGEGCSYLFQKPRLLPWKTVEENIAFALPETMKLSDKKEKCRDLISLVGLEGFEDYLPSRLSGGMEQRCAIARAFVSREALLFMDEPFQGLDLKLKMPLIELLKDLLQRRQSTSLLVTHDVREAILMGDRIVTLDGPPLKITGDLQGISLQDRNTESSAFYKLEKTLYSLILQ